MAPFLVDALYDWRTDFSRDVHVMPHSITVNHGFVPHALLGAKVRIHRLLAKQLGQSVCELPAEATSQSPSDSPNHKTGCDLFKFEAAIC